MHNSKWDGSDLKGVSCEATKNVDLGDGINCREIKNGTQLTEGEETTLIELLREYKDIFAWDYTEQRNIPESIGVHRMAKFSTCSDSPLSNKS